MISVTGIHGISLQSETEIDPHESVKRKRPLRALMNWLEIFWDSRRRRDVQLSLCLSFSVESNHLVKGSHVPPTQNVDFVIWMRAKVLEIKRGEIRLGNTPRSLLASHTCALRDKREGVKAGEVSVQRFSFPPAKPFSPEN